jgi:hypothetical protein
MTCADRLVRNMERAGIPRHVAMQISGHRTESMYRRYDIVVDADLKSRRREVGRLSQAAGRNCRG